MQNRNKSFKNKNNNPFIIANERIRHKEVRVTLLDGESKIMSISNALRAAEEAKLDLVLIADNALPPVCKITDLSKHIYAIKQKEKLAKRKQRESIVELKEIRMGLNIDTHDLETKAGMARKFLDKNNKVTVTVVLKGRERSRQDAAKVLLNTFADILDITYEQISTQNNRVSGNIK